MALEGSGFISSLNKRIHTAVHAIAMEDLNKAPGPIGIFKANPYCCPICDMLDGNLYPLSSNIYSISHPNCICDIVPTGEISEQVDGINVTFTSTAPESVEFGDSKHAPHPVLRPFVEKVQGSFVPDLANKLRGNV